MSEPTRAARRAQIAKNAQDRADRTAKHEAATFGRSMKCHGWDLSAPPRHAGTPDGCKNDGTSCICECHDQAAAIARGRGETDTKEHK